MFLLLQSTHLDLNIEHRIGANSEAKSRLDMVRKPLLIALLDGAPLRTEGLVFCEG